ncbi:hypothetical protein DICA3_E04038 [Diutina catenulata]
MDTITVEILASRWEQADLRDTRVLPLESKLTTDVLSFEPWWDSFLKDLPHDLQTTAQAIARAAVERLEGSPARVHEFEVVLEDEMGLELTANHQACILAQMGTAFHDTLASTSSLDDALFSTPCTNLQKTVVGLVEAYLVPSLVDFISLVHRVKDPKLRAEAMSRGYRSLRRWSRLDPTDMACAVFYADLPEECITRLQTIFRGKSPTYDQITSRVHEDFS